MKRPFCACDLYSTSVAQVCVARQQKHIPLLLSLHVSAQIVFELALGQPQIVKQVISLSNASQVAKASPEEHHVLIKRSP